jgi:DNA-3-methyladenine glycosylase I
MADAGIIRNLLKIQATINNAKRFIEVQHEFGNFSKYIWGFVDSKTVVNHWQTNSEIPAHTELSDRIAADLKKRGFKFIGSTVVYSHMQATGMVNDHLVSCFRHREFENLRLK